MTGSASWVASLFVHNLSAFAAPRAGGRPGRVALKSGRRGDIMFADSPRANPLALLFRLPFRIGRSADVAPPKPSRDDPQAACGVIGLTREERVRAAFSEVPPNDLEQRALRALLDNPGATGPALSRKCGWVDVGWQTQMILICQRRRHILWPGGPGSDATNGIILSAIVDYDPETLQFRCRRELAGIIRRSLTPGRQDRKTA
ncbi:hypothetical protein DQW77_07780 [Roseovarius sp. TE539]|nr:hypothetical protein DQW77_07780 [Roseovarius sp. TE539]